MSGCRLGGGIQVEVVRWRAGCRGEVGKKESQRGQTPYYIKGGEFGFVLVWAWERKEKGKG